MEWTQSGRTRHNNRRPSSVRSWPFVRRWHGCAALICLFALVQRTPVFADEVLVVNSPAVNSPAAEPSIVESQPATIRKLRSQHLILHTDMDRSAAQTLLRRLDAKLREVSSYWSRSVSQPIECFIVADLNNWTEEELGNRYASEVIRQVSGFATRGGKGQSSGAKLYASADTQVALHELVHAYCLEAFPDSGPDWYKEGIAVHFANTHRSENGVQIGDDVIEYLRNAPHRTARSIVESREFTSSIANIISSAVDVRDRESILADAAIVDEVDGEIRDAVDADTSSLVADDAKSAFAPAVTPNAADQKAMSQAINAYRWSWALCHFLQNNDNYTDRFGKLGQAYLNGARPSFDKVFANNDQLEAEFHQFIRELGRGYRVDLCHWDWSDESKPIADGQTVKTKVCARRGLQTSNVLVRQGVTYLIETEGHWSIVGGGVRHVATGNGNGAGQLSAAVMTDCKMGVPIEIANDGTFTADENGTLFFRCRDSWLEIADNHGCVVVSIRRVGE